MPTPIKSPASVATERVLSLSKQLNLKDSLNPADDLQKAAKMAATDYKFHGWMGLDKNATKGEMKWQEYEPKTWTEDDVDIKVTHCGICGSDLHTLRSGWVRSPLRVSISKVEFLTPCPGPHSLPVLRRPRSRRHCRQGRQERQASEGRRPLWCRCAV